MTDSRKKCCSAISLLVLLAFSLLVMYYIGIPMVKLARQPELFRNWVDSFGIWGRLIFVAMVVLQVIVALIPGEPLELAAGYAFGAIEGTLLSMTGILIGSILVFVAVRTWGVKLVRLFFEDREISRLSFLKDPKKSLVMTFVLMTVPGTPKDLLSYFAGLTPLSLGQWICIVSVSRIPSLVTSTVSGAAAGEQNYLLAVCVFLFTLLISGCGVWYYRKLSKNS